MVLIEHCAALVCVNWTKQHIDSHIYSFFISWPVFVSFWQKHVSLRNVYILSSNVQDCITYPIWNATAALNL